ncbi:glycogen synthase [Klebsiella pneumoniae]|uniref:ADP-glucose type glycogen/starch synthase n=1 Tax=Klebsiella oxytoca TaxID=571 RepID=A0A318FE05_KLEOX|nr:ADP-glucose type glycogen/starch synthase [Klebsiella oxytoca]SAQ65746.1 glycogen synthase [Klebsiella michiganensis]SLT11687.1 glycogen synthase [Klebsiella pneumoniae]VGP64779.1 Glycogen synthase [Klebsiella quasipneumoniae subsp. quasipneumoniae]SLT29912.1 glycogen synthase [Klebsiella pneumoniae]
MSRLTSQKGLDLLFGALPGIISKGGQLALLGSGDPDLQARFLTAEAQYPGQVSIRIGYDEALSHQMIGGADVILVPSRFEPCGLTQLYGLRYGTLPLVRRTGGLADTVADCSLENLVDGLATGFVFTDSETESLLHAIHRASVLWSRPSLWRYVQRQAMSMDFSWQSAAKSFHLLYQRII